MRRSIILIFVFCFMSLTYSCVNDTSTVENLQTEEEDLHSLDASQEEFESLFSMDSLNKINEELDRKLDSFENLKEAKQEE